MESELRTTRDESRAPFPGVGGWGSQRRFQLVGDSYNGNRGSGTHVPITHPSPLVAMMGTSLSTYPKARNSFCSVN